MYKRLHYIYAFALIISGAVFNKTSAQGPLLFPEEYFSVDTLKRHKLDSVLITTGLRRAPSSAGTFAVGSNIISVDSKALQNSKMNSLADYIREQSSVYLKEYGRGMSAFISVRGTSSSHTSLSWNGMSLAVPTLGQTDLSHVPVYFFDNMKLHIGGASSLYGDGSIGGSIQLSTSPLWKRGINGDVTLSAGSFSTFFTGATVRYSNGKTESRTSIFRSSAQNDYTFRNNTKTGEPKERLKNSGYENYGVMQELHRKFRDSSQISFNMWFLQFDRQIQPSVSLNDRPESYASILDRNFRGSLSYSGGRSKVSYSGRVSYSNDYERYKNDIIAASRLAANAEGQYNSSKTIVKLGLSAEYTVPSVESYTFAVKERRGYIYLLARYNPLTHLYISAGARAGGVTSSEVPFMPSLDIKFNAIRSEGHNLSLRASASRNSKIPSLNDRYWGGTHTYLKSEISSTLEGGADYSLFRGVSSLAIFTTVYTSRVKNWIRWLPAGQVWRPQNIPLVSSKGVEAGVTYNRRAGRWDLKGTLYYSYTNVKMAQPLWREDPSAGKQLAYQPLHSWRASAGAESGPVSFSVNLSYTGERTTLDIFDKLPDYLLADASITYKTALWGREVTLSGVVKNITNTRYQNVKFYAMAPLNYMVNVVFSF